ncbi:hypothetical protein [Streptomyces sp. NPDC055992]|uniref:hypothetical protein n=1 Tax=Streptomyces sp. NPDC055992 TaxID=3345673 RepID=UPI0035DD4D71
MEVLAAREPGAIPAQAHPHPKAAVLVGVSTKWHTRLKSGSDSQGLCLAGLLQRVE